jgi:hypothetical protein
MIVHKLQYEEKKDEQEGIRRDNPEEEFPI